MGAHQTKMMGKVTLLFVVAMAAGANATACTITACTTTDGSTVAGGSGCYCGTDNVFVTATQFCYKKAGNTGLAMTKKLCAERTGANTNGVTANDVCTCSTTLATPLTTTSAGFCFVDATGAGQTPTAAAQAACANTVAGATGTACFCGTSTTTAAVAVSASEFCYQKATTNEGVRFTNKLCTGANALGTGDTSSDLCTCSTTLATPLTTSTNKYCFIGANGVGIVAAAANAACANTVAGATGTACSCGGTSTTTPPVAVSASEFCYQKATTNEGVTFTKKLCTGTSADGTGDTSSDLCTCSTTLATPLTTSTNKYCFIGANGVGIVAAAANAACANTVAGATGTACSCGGTSTTTPPVAVSASEFCYQKATTNEGVTFTK